MSRTDLRRYVFWVLAVTVTGCKAQSGSRLRDDDLAIADGQEARPAVVEAKIRRHANQVVLVNFYRNGEHAGSGAGCGRIDGPIRELKCGAYNSDPSRYAFQAALQLDGSGTASWTSESSGKTVSFSCRKGEDRDRYPNGDVPDFACAEAAAQTQASQASVEARIGRLASNVVIVNFYRNGAHSGSGAGCGRVEGPLRELKCGVYNSDSSRHAFSAALQEDGAGTASWSPEGSDVTHALACRKGEDRDRNPNGTIPDAVCIKD